MSLLIALHFFDHGLQADHIGRPHRPPAPGREAIAVDVDRIDVARTKRNAFVEELGAGVRELEEQALDDFIGSDRAPRDPLALRLVGIHRLDLGIWLRRALALGIEIKATARLLAEAAKLCDLVVHRVAHLLLVGERAFLADAPAYIDAREIAHGEWAH